MSDCYCSKPTILKGICSFMIEEWESPIEFSGSRQADSIKKLAK